MANAFKPGDMVRLKETPETPEHLPNGYEFIASAYSESLGKLKFFVNRDSFYVTISDKGWVYAKYDPTLAGNFDFGAVRIL